MYGLYEVSRNITTLYWCKPDVDSTKKISSESTKKFEDTRGITRCQKWKQMIFLLRLKWYTCSVESSNSEYNICNALKKVRRYQRDNQEPYIGGQTLQWPMREKDKGIANDIQSATHLDVLYVLFLLIILLSVLRFKDSDYPFGIFKLFL